MDLTESEFMIDNDYVIRYMKTEVFEGASIEKESTKENMYYVVIDYNPLDSNKTHLVDVYEFPRMTGDDVYIADSTIGKVIVKDLNGSKEINSIFPEQSIPSEFIELHDEYDLSGRVEFIDFENGKYYTLNDGELKQLDIKTGEPLYDGAADKGLRFGGMYLDFEKVSHKEQGWFYVVTDEGEVALIDSNMDLVASTQIENENPFKVGIDKDRFYILDTQEYQRKDVIFLSGMYYGEEL